MAAPGTTAAACARRTAAVCPAVARPAVAAAELAAWEPDDDGQRALKYALLAFLDARPDDACARECVPGHLTASALVLDATGEHMLLTLHTRFGRWVQLGGHCEPGDATLRAAALREATEESGIDGLTIYAAAAAPGRPPGPLLARRADPPPRRALPGARPRGRRAPDQRRIRRPALVAGGRAAAGQPTRSPRWRALARVSSRSSATHRRQR